MRTSEIYEWIKKEENRKQTLAVFRQPLTAAQIARATGIPRDTCGYVIGKFHAKKLVRCLNPTALSSRLYWLTDRGMRFRKRLCQDMGIPYSEADLEGVDWELYGWICFSHRSAVIKAMNEPMQPAHVKHVIRRQRPGTRISANNIRDVVKLLVKKGIARPVKVRKKAHLRYELTDMGNRFRELLLQAETRV